MDDGSKRQRPEWAKAAIVAEYQIDVSDSMTDYFATRTDRHVFLAWSRTERNSFAEMRKAAATFKPTEHLGPGRDAWSVWVVFSGERNGTPVAEGGNCPYYAGDRSHWHGEIQTDESFPTRADAEAYIARIGEPEPILFGGTKATFEWKIGCESYEHREDYSMGRGLVLGAGAYRTGWTIRKRPLSWGGTYTDEILALPGPKPEEIVKPNGNGKPKPGPVAVGEVTVRPSTVRDGFVEVVHPSKPDPEVRDELKAAGFRWAIRSRCWYGPAERLPGRYTAEAPRAGEGV